MNIPVVKIQLPKPYKKQREIILDPTRFKVVCAGRRVGKSVMGKIIALREMRKGKRVLYIGTDWAFCDDFFDDILSLIPEIIILKKNRTRKHLVINNGNGTTGQIKFHSGEVLNKLRSREWDYIIIDECAHIDNMGKYYYDVIRPLLLSTQGHALFISTPLGKNFFYSLFERGLRGEKDYKSWQFSSHENPMYHTPEGREELQSLINELPESAYSQEILAIPGENASNPFGIQNIDNCLDEVLSSNPTVCYGIDFGQKNDFTVIIGQDEYGNMTYFDRWNGLPWIQTLDRIKQLRERDTAMIVVDSTANQSSLSEDLQMSIYNVVGFDFTQKTKPAIMLDLIKDVERQLIRVNRITADEMKVLQYKITPNGHIKYEAQSGFKDDCVMALAMCNYHRKLFHTNINNLVYGTF